MLSRIPLRTLLALTLLASAVFAPGLLASQQQDWTVMVASNAFISHRGTTYQPVAMGGSVKTGDRLITRVGGALVLSRGEDLITMAEKTEVSIVDPQPVHTTLIEQPYGQAQYHVTHEPTPHFEVDTPLLATVVKGTTFTVKASATEGAVAVQDGRVTAIDRRTGASSSVGAGQKGAVQSGGNSVSVSANVAPASTPAAAPPAPGAPADAPAPGPKDKPKGPDGPAGPGGGPGGGGPGGPGGGGPAGGGPGGGPGKPK